MVPDVFPNITLKLMVLFSTKELLETIRYSEERLADKRLIEITLLIEICHFVYVRIWHYHVGRDVRKSNKSLI
jgi:hypothetical protein